MPGSPPSQSISSPESSASTIISFAEILLQPGIPFSRHQFRMPSALIFAFSSKVVPFSSISVSMPASFNDSTFHPVPSRISRISFIFPAFPVAKMICFIFLPALPALLSSAVLPPDTDKNRSSSYRCRFCDSCPPCARCPAVHFHKK